MKKIIIATIILISCSCENNSSFVSKYRYYDFSVFKGHTIFRRVSYNDTVNVFICPDSVIDSESIESYYISFYVNKDTTIVKSDSLDSAENNIIYKEMAKEFLRLDIPMIYVGPSGSLVVIWKDSSLRISLIKHASTWYRTVPVDFE